MPNSGKMVRLLFFLALIFVISKTQAASFEEDVASCEEFRKYSGTDDAFYVAVRPAGVITLENSENSPVNVNDNPAAEFILFVITCLFFFPGR